MEQEDKLEQLDKKQEPKRNLWLTKWAVNNKTPVYLLVIIITAFGLYSYNTLPKEQFPEVVFPTITVTTIYPGASPEDMENLITREIENECNTINRVRRISSNSIQDFSIVLVEFETDVDVDEAKDQVKDAVDKARSELPNDLEEDPEVEKVEINDIPIMYINVAGDYDDQRLKDLAEELQEEIENISAINRVDMVGAREREIHVNVDLYRIQAAGIALGDIENAIRSENVVISGGNLEIEDLNYSIRVVGEFDTPGEIEDIVVRSPRGAKVYMREIADVEDTFKDRESYARVDGKKTITLNVIKRGGENLIETADKIREIIDRMEEEEFPRGLEITVFGDTSDRTRTTLNDLVNTIVLGFLLVTLTLAFFMGVNNALFVGLAVPLSAFIAFLVIPTFDFTLNIVVLFALLMALGILVDNAIVVVENTYRIFDNGRNPIDASAKYAAAEVFIPVLGGVLTTLAPFFPLLFWPGITGEFMKYLPATLIVTLAASMFVAFVINPVFAASFMRARRKPAKGKKRSHKTWWLIVAAIGLFTLLFYLGGNVALGNFGVTLVGVMFLTRFAFEPMINWFQQKLLPRLETFYERAVTWAVHKRRPYALLAGTVGLLIISFIAVGVSAPSIVFFPQSDPNFAYVYIDQQVGSTTEDTDSLARQVEQKVFQALSNDRDIVESVITNVAVAAGDPNPTSFEQGTRPEKAKITVAFVEYSERGGKSSKRLLEEIRDSVQGFAGTEITVEPEQSGPPTGPPINIEIRGEDFEQLVEVSTRFQAYLDSIAIPGVEELTNDLELNKPEIVFRINRDRANRLGINTATLGTVLRTAVNGNEVSQYREGEDQYPIIVRLEEDYRQSLSRLRNLNITFMDMATGSFKQIPASAIADFEIGSSYGGIKRKDLKRVVTVSSNVLEGYNANAINQQIRQLLKSYPLPDGITIELTGEQEDQKETADFLGLAMLLSVMLILFILTTLFNSIGKTFIILSQVLFSVIGVLLGFAIFRMELSIVMTGVGIVALAGIVVNNGILLIEFTDLLKKQGWKTRDAIIEAGKIRLKPVLLTAISTILGLIPLAVAFNIDFPGLFANLEPGIYFGGDNAAFWGPLSWTIIFGLLFATILTLVVVPALYLIYYAMKIRLWRRFNRLRHKLRN